MAITLYMIRHGQTEENAANILQGHLPGHLTDEGRQQACQAREALRHIPFDAIYSSDLLRCADTATIVGAPHPIPIHYSTLLRERDWGPFTGMDIKQAVHLLDDRAETVAHMYERAIAFLTALTQNDEHHTVLVVSHGLFCRVLQGAILHTTIKKIPRMDNAEIRQLTLTPPYHFGTEATESGATAS